MKRNLKLLFIGLLTGFVLWISNQNPHKLVNDTAGILLENFTQDTGSINAVTGIYLNYRVYDTLFEALMLLVSVIGIIHFSRHEGGDHHE